jgi:3',5'-cyclic AMP phosphodiesterase CpdA
MRVIQISDTHLSPGKSHFADNWPPLVRWIAAQQPDLVVHSGDVTVDGAGVDEDLRHAAGLLTRLGVRCRALPGNHDIGDAGHPRQPVTEARLGRWHAHFGPDWWVEDCPGWRLIGLDALILGTGSSAEAAQRTWLEAIMADSPGRRIAWFIHRPLFIDSPDEADTGYWSVKPEPRAWLMGLRQRHRVALVASGHLHKMRQFQLDGTQYVWAPASSFVVGDMQPAMPGKKRLGAVRYDFDPAGLAAEIVEVPGLAVRWLDDVIHEVYPRPPAAPPRA